VGHVFYVPGNPFSSYQFATLRTLSGHVKNVPHRRVALLVGHVFTCPFYPLWPPFHARPRCRGFCVAAGADHEALGPIVVTALVRAIA